LDDLKKKLLQDIKGTGFPLELRVTDIFSKQGWSVMNNVYYIDKDEMKGREIDLIAENFFRKSDGTNGLYFCFSLLVEMKKTEKKPWIFFTSNNGNRHYPRHTVQNSYAKNVRLSNVFMFEQHLHKKLGQSFYQGFTGNSGRDDIFKAISGSVKALCHFKESSYIHHDNDNKFVIQLFEPLVILQGDLFSASLNDEGDIEIEETNYVQMLFNYLSPNYNTENNYQLNSSFLVHVVRFEYLNFFLEDYLSKQNRVFNQMILHLEEFGNIKLK
jgi:hypothetical protein